MNLEHKVRDEKGKDPFVNLIRNKKDLIFFLLSLFLHTDPFSLTIANDNGSFHYFFFSLTFLFINFQASKDRLVYLKEENSLSLSLSLPSLLRNSYLELSLFFTEQISLKERKGGREKRLVYIFITDCFYPFFLFSSSPSHSSRKIYGLFNFRTAKCCVLTPARLEIEMRDLHISN